MRSPNVAGQSYALMVLTPVRPGMADALRAYLEALPRDDSPLARLPRTHMARFIVIPEMPCAPGTGLLDPLGDPYLLFTSNFDGDLDSYLGELAEALEPEAEEIWGRCIGCPRPAVGAALKAYLGRNQIDSGVVFAAYGDATVAGVRRALDKRERLTDFAVRAQDMKPGERRRRFLEEFGTP
ncbi:MAG TPA: hypothetical protein VMY78_10500 [Solirubrobacteraceae bacterium]|nr:hypothetical protein [Solirubrobacteraceae bacterium]